MTGGPRRYLVKRKTVAGREVRFTPFSAHFDGMGWPTIGKATSSLQWRFRYEDMSRITRSDLLQAASIICAYQALVHQPAKERQSIVRVLREVDDTPLRSLEWHPSDGIGDWPEPEDAGRAALSADPPRRGTGREEEEDDRG